MAELQKTLDKFESVTIWAIFGPKTAVEVWMTPEAEKR